MRNALLLTWPLNHIQNSLFFRSITTNLKRRRKEIDYKVLSQREKNRESNAFALVGTGGVGKSAMKQKKCPADVKKCSENENNGV